MPLGKEVGLGPGHIVLDGDPVGTLPPSPQQPLHTFRPMSVVAKRSPVSATAELSYYIFTAWLYGPSLQLVGARFLNLLLSQLSRDFKLREMSILQDFQNGHNSLLLDARVTWSGVVVVLYVLCMPM